MPGLSLVLVAAPVWGLNVPLSSTWQAASRAASRVPAVWAAAEPCQDEQAIRADATTAFQLLDLNGDGGVSKEEFGIYLRQFRYTDTAISKVFEALDVDANGFVELDELRDGLAEYCRCEACTPKFVGEVHAEADAMFDVIDDNGDGSISGDELVAHLSRIGYAEPAIDAVFRSLDSNGDGALSREELRAGFLSYSTLRQAMVAVVTTLVKRKTWSASQRSPA